MVMKLEVVVVLVSDVDKAKPFDGTELGWREDAGFSAGDAFRVIALAEPVHETPEHHDRSDRPTPEQDWWDGYDAYMTAGRQRRSAKHASELRPLLRPSARCSATLQRSPGARRGCDQCASSAWAGTTPAPGLSMASSCSTFSGRRGPSAPRARPGAGDAPRLANGTTVR